jgi:hypothetical protein
MQHRISVLVKAALGLLAIQCGGQVASRAEIPTATASWRYAQLSCSVSGLPFDAKFSIKAGNTYYSTCPNGDSNNYPTGVNSLNLGPVTSCPIPRTLVATGCTTGESVSTTITCD